MTAEGHDVVSVGCANDPIECYARRAVRVTNCLNVVCQVSIGECLQVALRQLRLEVGPVGGRAREHKIEGKRHLEADSTRKHSARLTRTHGGGKHFVRNTFGILTDQIPPFGSARSGLVQTRKAGQLSQNRTICRMVLR